MSATSIEWTDHSVNPIRARLRLRNGATLTAGGKALRAAGLGSGVGHFCEKISSGCANCYASRSQPRFGMPGFTGASKRLSDHRLASVANGAVQVSDDVEVFFDESRLAEVLRRKKATKYFWCDQTDLFGWWVPDAWIDKCFATMALTPWHTHQVLTKRPGRMAEYLSTQIGRIADRIIAMRRGSGDSCLVVPLPHISPGRGRAWWPLPNVWLGTSIENKATLTRLNDLRRCPAGVRFLSLEPLLEDLGAIDLEGVDWVIVGGESGAGARPCHPDWVRSIRDQCVAAGVAFFFKQWGEWVPVHDHVDRHYRNGRPGFGDSNREYNQAINRMVRSHGGTKLVDDRPEGWQPYMIRGGMGINGGGDDKLFLVNVGKSAAGRLLDGRTWDEMPVAEMQKSE